MLVILALIAGFGFGNRNQKAEEQLRNAKQAYQEALAKTGDFDCTAPEFDQVLKLFEAVPRGTPARREAKDLVKSIREKRAAAGQHARAVDAAAAQPVRMEAAPAAPPSAAPADCKLARKKMVGLKVARKKAGKPPLGEVSMLKSGEVGYTPGAEPTAEEESLLNQLKACEGQ